MALAGLVVVGSSVVGVGTARLTPAGATTGACQSGTGVTVVIDFGDLAGSAPVTPKTVVACAPGPVDTGFGALTGAGIGYQGAARSPGFVCRIAGKPSDDPCINPSPATAYWSYWLAVRGGPWCVSPSGAGNRTPPAGTVEGWVFEHDPSGDVPVHPPEMAAPAPLAGVAPASLGPADCVSTAPVPTTTSTTAIPSAPGGGAGTGTGSAPTPTTPPRTGTSVAPSTPGSSVTVAPDGTSSTTSGPAGTTPVAAGPTDGGATGVDLSGGGDDSGPTGAIVTGGLLTAIGAAALLVRRRRAGANRPPEGGDQG